MPAVLILVTIVVVYTCETSIRIITSFHVSIVIDPQNVLVFTLLLSHRLKWYIFVYVVTLNLFVSSTPEIKMEI